MLTGNGSQVPNFLPSISAAIGNYRTQRFVWGTAIAVHAGPRFLFTSMYRQYYKDILTNGAQKLASIACFLNIIENVALIGLTFIPSAYNYGETNFLNKCVWSVLCASQKSLQWFVYFWLITLDSGCNGYRLAFGLR